ERVGKKGVVRDPATHLDVLRSVLRFVREEMGWFPAGISFSPIRGPEGNIEFLLHLLPSGECPSVTDADAEQVVAEAHREFSEGDGA
ncbi:MAG: TlyA family rRNA (cytidine-2'-O)-methyltransferase, partial [Clostridiales bacterium]|nr:TlyA family rRNA (cytidine-2'-O)-methyltransferase [Clostridiales bacterium]